MSVQDLHPRVSTPREITESMLQTLIDGVALLDEHLNKHPDSINHVRWVAKEGDPGCQGAAVVVTLIERGLGRIKTRIMNKVAL